MEIGVKGGARGGREEGNCVCRYVWMKNTRRGNGREGY